MTLIESEHHSVNLSGSGWVYVNLMNLSESERGHVDLNGAAACGEVCVTPCEWTAKRAYLPPALAPSSYSASACCMTPLTGHCAVQELDEKKGTQHEKLFKAPTEV